MTIGIKELVDKSFCWFILKKLIPF